VQYNQNKERRMIIGTYEMNGWQKALVKALRARALRNRKPTEWGGDL
jgi:hypothetical protein